MEVKAINEALPCLWVKRYRGAIIVIDSVSTLQRISRENPHPDWGPVISTSKLERLIWVFSPGYAGIQGNER